MACLAASKCATGYEYAVCRNYFSLQSSAPELSDKGREPAASLAPVYLVKICERQDGQLLKPERKDGRYDWLGLTMAWAEYLRIGMSSSLAFPVSAWNIPQSPTRALLVHQHNITYVLCR